MAFSDPIVLGGVYAGLSLPRVSFSGSTGSFADADGSTTVSFTHTSGKRVRHTIRLDEQVVVPDALNPALNTPVGHSVYLVVDAPKVGFTAHTLTQSVEALCLFLTAGDNANAVKFVSGQS